jgi:hypothetical protein
VLVALGFNPDVPAAPASRRDKRTRAGSDQRAHAGTRTARCACHRERLTDARAALAGGGAGRKLCRFYQHGHCRFGARCQNRHTDPESSTPLPEPDRCGGRSSLQSPAGTTVSACSLARCRIELLARCRQGGHELAGAASRLAVSTCEPSALNAGRRARHRLRRGGRGELIVGGGCARGAAQPGGPSCCLHQR